MALGIQGNKGKGHATNLTAFIFYNHFHDFCLRLEIVFM